MGSSASGDVTIHYNQAIIDAYQKMIWYAFNDGGPDLPGKLQEQPFDEYPDKVDKAYTDIYYNYYKPQIEDIGDIRATNVITQSMFIDNMVVDLQIAQHNIYLEDDIQQNVLPKLKAGLRDIGAVMTSSFLDSQAMVEMNKHKAVSKFSADLKMKMFDLSQQVWTKWLDWQWQTVDFSIKFIESYFRMLIPYSNMINKLVADNKMFPWNILDQVRAIVGSLNQAQTGRSSTNTPSQMQQAGAYVGIAAGVAGMAADIYQMS